MERYRYRPLLPAKHSIRLLQILPGFAGTEIHCRIIDYTIRDDRASGLFEALSYVWGTTSNPSKIFVADIASAVDSSASEHYLEVTSNLHDALQELRDPALPRIMWIDAICINQDDLEERSSQVNFMANIYSYANQVVIWLGPDDGEKTQKLFTAIKDAAEIAHQAIDANRYRSSLPYNPDGSNECERDDNFLEVSLEDLLARPWFSRVWVLQEAAAARAILVKCGVFEMPGSMFTNGIQFLQAGSIHRGKLPRGPSASVLETMSWYKPEVDRPSSTYLSDYFRKVHARRTTSLGDLVERFYLHGVSDRRDTIFAILNLCSPESRRFMKPDYTKPWSDIWADTTRQILGLDTIATVHTQGEQTCLTVFGYVLGTIKLSSEGNLTMTSIYSSGPLAWRAFWGPESWCNAKSWCKCIQNDDIVFFTVGSTAPSIIRACGDHFDIIVIAVPAPLITYSDQSRWSTSDFDWREMLSSLTYSPRRASLIWDWCTEYPNSCTCHHQLFDDVLGTPGPHPDNISRMEDSAYIVATLLPSVDNSTRTVSTASQRSIDYMLRQSNNSTFPSVLQTQLRLLKMLLRSNDDKDLYVWLVRQFEILRQILWILCHYTDVLTSCTWMFDYHRSERHPYYNVFDILSIVGLEVRPDGDKQVLGLHLTDTTDTHNGEYFTDLFQNGVWRNYIAHIALSPDLNYRQKRRRRNKGVWRAQHGIRRYLVATVIRHCTFTLADIQIAPQALLQRPLIPLRMQLVELQLSINLRAFALISMFRPGKLALTWSNQEWSFNDRHANVMSVCLFSEPYISNEMAYSTMSMLFGQLAQAQPGDQPMTLQERLSHVDAEENPGGHRLSRMISKRLSGEGMSDRNFEVLVSLFISCHLETLTRYIESTDILEIAAATANDKILPFLRGLLDLDPDRCYTLQAYREHMVAQYASRKRLPPPSDSEFLLDSSEDSTGGGEGLLDGVEASKWGDEGSVVSDEGLVVSDEGSVVSDEDTWQSNRYDSPPDEF